MAERLAPEDIARASFGTVRRGYEPQAVRAFLHEVSSLVDRLTRTEKDLREKLARAEALVGSADEPDEAMLLEVLGAETTRVLTSAREAATEIRTKAEETAERVIAEATAEAAERRATAMREVEQLVARMTAEAEQLRDAAHNELELRRAEAHAASERLQEEAHQKADALRDEAEAELARAREQAESIVEAARQEGRDMVAEAQAVRERVLRDLAVRRKRARQQVEKLNAGRERLLRAYDTVRGTLDDATAELHGSIVEARAAASDAARRVEAEPEPSLDELDAEVTAVALGDLTIGSDSADAPGAVDLGYEHDEDDDEDEDDDDEYIGGSGPLSGEVPAVGWPEDESEEPDEEPEGSDDHVAPEAVGHEAGQEGDHEHAPRTFASLDERRGRKGRRKKGFEGLPPGELTVLEPPRPDEGVRVIAEPALDDANDADAAEPVTDPVSEANSDEVAEVDRGDATGALEDEQALEPPEAPPDSPADASAADVFARLREQAEAQHTDTTPTGDEATDAETGVLDDGDRAASPSADAPAETASEPEPAADEDEEPSLDDDDAPEEREEFVARAAAVASVEKDLLKRLKRALADEQNEVLDLLRRAKPKGVDDVLPAPEDHAARWVEAAAPSLRDAAAAGAAAVGGTPGSVTSLANELARDLVDPLRERIDRSFTAADGDLEDVADRVRALYREWKGQRLTEVAANFAVSAYGRGMFAGIPSGASVHWVIDAVAGACPDCEDNVLAGAITKGEEFPTGSTSAPAHTGCHCLVLPHPG